MKNKLFLFLALIGMMLSQIVSAESFEVNGIYYYASGNNAEVVQAWQAGGRIYYSGDVVIPSTVNYNGNTYNVTSIGNNAFLDCSNLTPVTIPNSVTSIGYSAFVGCSGLTSVTIPSSVMSIEEGNFRDCTSLPVTNNIRYADCYAIEAVDKSLASYTFKEGTRFIGSSAFNNCSSLTSITIPNSVTSIGNNAFAHCFNLTSITIPNSVTSIGEYALADCRNLTDVTIGSGVTSIGNSCFYTSYLKSITVEALTPPSLGSNAITSVTTIYVPEASVETYKTASRWSSYADKIQAIQD